MRAQAVRRCEAYRNGPVPKVSAETRESSATAPAAIAGGEEVYGVSKAKLQVAMLSRGSGSLLKEALHVGFVDMGFTGRYVVQLARLHPALEFIHHREQMIEAFHDEQQRLIVIDFERPG